MRQPNLDLFGQFPLEGISILKDGQGRCFLALVCNNVLTKLATYDLLASASTDLITIIHPETKQYSLVLKLVFKQIEMLEYYYDTHMTSKQYPRLIWLNNCRVQYITTTETVRKGKDFYQAYKVPLIKLSCTHMN